MDMKTKMKMKKKTMKKRVLPTAKRDGVLPILPILCALGFLIGGATGVAKSVIVNKAAQRQLKKLLRHAEGHGHYLSPYKYGYKDCTLIRGQGVITKKKM